MCGRTRDSVTTHYGIENNDTARKPAEMIATSPRPAKRRKLSPSPHDERTQERPESYVQQLQSPEPRYVEPDAPTKKASTIKNNAIIPSELYTLEVENREPNFEGATSSSLEQLFDGTWNTEETKRQFAGHSDRIEHMAPSLEENGMVEPRQLSNDTGRGNDETEISADFSANESVDNPYISNPLQHFKLRALPVLEILADEILEFISHDHLVYLIDGLSQSPDYSDLTKTWSSIHSLFCQSRKIYSHDEHYIKQSNHFAPNPQAGVYMRKTNLATAISAIVNGSGSDILGLHQNFLSAFSHEKRLSKWQGDLFFDLKLQVCFARLEVDQMSEWGRIVDDTFPGDLPKQLRDRDSCNLSRQLDPDELDFVEKCWRTRKQLMATSPLDLLETRGWREFQIKALQILRSNAHSLVRNVRVVEDQQDEVPSPQEYDQCPPQAGTTQDESPQSYEDDVYDQDEMVRRAALAAHAAMAVGDENYSEGQTPEMDRPPSLPRSTQPNPSGALPHLGPLEESSSIRAQYEKARQAATAKASVVNRGKNPSQSQRRPWSTDEEDALMSALDIVKGPHWSQILAMHGSGGSISEVLKDRNQVQLKDKARNLKLFFLKSGIEVPNYLRHVTGELKTRAPAQAAKHEARERQQEIQRADRASADGVQDVSQNGFQGINSGYQRTEARPPEMLDQHLPEDVDAVMSEAIRQAVQAVNQAERLETGSDNHVEATLSV